MKKRNSVLTRLQTDKMSIQGLMKYQKKMISVFVVILFIAVLKIGSELYFVTCRFYLQIQELNQDEKAVTLWSVNEGKVHKYVPCEGDTINFNLRVNETDKIKDLVIMLDGCSKEVKICGLAVVAENGRLDYGTEQISENFQFVGVSDFGIKEDGRLWIKTGTSKWEIRSSDQFIKELNDICNK